jgi:non-specific serine/threonine protein kinase
MATSAPPSRSARHNLPASLTSFIGREHELADVQARLADGRLLTLTGVGGCGKTRLALEVARALLDRYSDGVWLVELGPLADPTLVPHSVAAVVGVRESAGQSTVAALAARLRTRRLLLVLDNCEHLLDGCARLVDALLRACPDVRVLATSREALGITGEIDWRVPSLPVPDPRRLPPLAELRQNPAVQLFAERAVAAQSPFVLTDRNAHAVAQVCARLDGIPLALELAAARVAALSVDQLAARLDQRFRLLTGGSRAALPRQQTLRATLDWSYDLLSEAERCLLTRLAVFAGGWSLEAAEAVCAGEPLDRTDLVDLLLRLVRKSLVVAEEDPGGIERYRLLETVRQYARERLVAAGEAEAIHQQHANHFLAYVEAQDPEQLLRTRTLQTQQARMLLTERPLLDHLEREQDNLRAALRWWIESLDADRALRQAAALFPIWHFRGSLTEGRAWLDELLSLPTAKSVPGVRVRALPMLGNLARRHGEYAVAINAFEELLAARDAAGDQRGAALALGDLANVHYMLADFPAAWACLEASRTVAGDRVDPVVESSWRFVGGQIALHEGRYEMARTLLTEELANPGRGVASTAPGQQRHSLYTGYCLMNLGTVAREQGEHIEAAALLGQGLRIAEEYGDRALLAHLLEGFSGLASALEQHDRAMCLGGAAEALREASGAPLSPAWRRMVDRWLEVSRATLSAEAGATAWQTGHQTPLAQAIAYAQAPAAPSTSGATATAEPRPADGPGPLTRREREVAALIAQGLSNRHIAERLVITDRTVAAHVEHILDKLAFVSRTQIGVWAAQHGLVGSTA